MRNSFAATILTLLPAAACGAVYEDGAVYEHDFDTDDPRPLVLVSDTQRTSIPETLLGREQNDPERAGIIAAIVEEDPALLIMLGDLVFDGGSRRHWSRFDELTEPIRETELPVRMVLGNHEYWFGAARSLGNAYDRFPSLEESHWQAHVFRGLGLVLLDSNRSALGAVRWQEQIEWYRRTLDEMDACEELRGVVVLLHHSPYTNSTVTGDEPQVQSAFVPEFLAARKTLAMIGGHAHAYEHFVKCGKHFVVSGGGGGPRVTLLEGDDRRHEDLYDSASPRPFHYLVLDPRDDGVAVLVKGFCKGETKARKLDAFVLPYSGHQANAGKK
jgi:Icc-related predicted phosphoesterase